MGTGSSKGTKVFALAGKVRRGGLIEVSMGVTLRQIVEDIGGGVLPGREFKAVQVGGPSGGCVPAALADTPVDYEALVHVGAIMGSGGLVVLDNTDCMVDIARYFLRFTQDQSCGKCTFCRIGTKRMLEIMDRICTGHGRKGDLEELEQLARSVVAGSICGLGKTAPNPVLSTLKYFRDEYEAHLQGKCPAGKCTALIRYEINRSCIGCTLCAQHCPVNAIPADAVPAAPREHGPVHALRHVPTGVSREGRGCRFVTLCHRRTNMPTITIDEQQVEVPAGATMLDAAEKLGIEIPTLCFLKGYDPSTSCLVCVVRNRQTGQYVPACATRVVDGMQIDNATEPVSAMRRTALELLLSDHVGDCLAPCFFACPAHMDIPLMLRQIGEQNVREAIATIKQDIALPAVLGRVCPKPCEKGCRRNAADSPVAVCELKRFVADADLASGDPYQPPCRPDTGQTRGDCRRGTDRPGRRLLPAAARTCLRVDRQGTARRRTLALRTDSRGTAARTCWTRRSTQILRLGVETRWNTTIADQADLDALCDEYDAVLLACGVVGAGTDRGLGTHRLAPRHRSESQHVSDRTPGRVCRRQPLPAQSTGGAQHGRWQGSGADDRPVRVGTRSARPLATVFVAHAQADGGRDAGVSGRSQLGLPQHAGRRGRVFAGAAAEQSESLPRLRLRGARQLQAGTLLDHVSGRFRPL